VTLIINEKEYKCKVMHFLSDSVDEDLILYNEEADKIIALNATSTIIFKEIEKAYENGEALYDTDITSLLSCICNIEKPQFDDILKDVRDTLCRFIEERILEVNDDLLV